MCEGDRKDVEYSKKAHASRADESAENAVAAVFGAASVASVPTAGQAYL